MKKFLYLVPLLVNIGCSSPKMNSPKKEIALPNKVLEMKYLMANKPLNDQPVFVRLSPGVDTYLISSKNGYHVNIFAKELGLIPNKFENYKDGEIAFSQREDSFLKKIVKKLDKNKDSIIDLEELIKVY